jgi:hypothetical protein
MTMLRWIKSLLGIADPGDLRHELSGVLQEAKILLLLPKNDFSWSAWPNEQAAIQEIDSLLLVLAQGHLPECIDASVLFAPTGPIQEVSLSSGWGDQFLLLADRFDTIARRLWQGYRH